MITLNYYDGWCHQISELHKSIGILLMMGPVIRVIWWLFSPPPAALANRSRLTCIAMAMDHLAFYLLLFSIAISGHLISTIDGEAISVLGWFDIPATLVSADSQANLASSLHLRFARTAMILSLLCGLMALRHHPIDNDDTLNCMLRKSSPDYGA